MDNYKDWLYALLKTEPIPPEDIPDIGLYMDQVTTLMDTRLAGSKRYPDDKILTKTMINNYVKHKLVKAPIKKKYEREQIAYFTLICLLKSVFSLDEISKLIQLQQSQKELSVFYNMYCDVFEHVLKTNHLDSELPDIYNKCILSSVYKIKVSDNLLGEETMEQALKKD